MPLPLATLEASPAAFLGPDVLSLFVEAMEMGFLICQLLIFWERGIKEQPAVWVLVGFVFVVAWCVLQLVYHPTIRHFTRIITACNRHSLSTLCGGPTSSILGTGYALRAERISNSFHRIPECHCRFRLAR